MITLHEKIYKDITEKVENNDYVKLPFWYTNDNLKYRAVDLFTDMVKLLNEYYSLDIYEKDLELERAILSTIEAFTDEPIEENVFEVFENLYYNFC